MSATDRQNARGTVIVFCDHHLIDALEDKVLASLRLESGYEIEPFSSPENLSARLMSIEDAPNRPILIITSLKFFDPVPEVLPHNNSLRFIVLGEVSTQFQAFLRTQWPHPTRIIEELEVHPNHLLMVVMEEIGVLRSEQHSRVRIRDLERLENHIDELNSIGASLSTEKDLDTLLEKILFKAREITRADSGSLYLVEESTESGKPERLRFKLAHNDSVETEFSEFTLAINEKSIVGHVTLHGETYVIDDVYHISKAEGFQHNREFDIRIGYRTKSMLVVPMKNTKDEVIGVLQLINKKKDPKVKLKVHENIADMVVPFDRTDLELVESLASQACVAIENARLYQNIQNLFEGFIQASVLAIESRDPTTWGHSTRVTTLTCALAEAVDKTTEGPFKDIQFSQQAMQELRYAALLHDFGKIGVPEQILTKAKKLFEHELEVIRARFHCIAGLTEKAVLEEKVRMLEASATEEQKKKIVELERKCEEDLKEVAHDLEIIMKSALPTVLEEGTSDKLQEIAKKKFTNPDGCAETYLTEKELEFLSIRKGSLNEDERKAIESHVTHSFNFLQQIPWTKELKRIPEIVHAHHEKLNGRGYPRKITKEKIPFETQIMTIVDIFDALSARDRTYKKAVPVDKAIDILRMEVNDGALDPDLFELFLKHELYRLVIDGPDDKESTN